MIEQRVNSVERKVDVIDSKVTDLKETSERMRSDYHHHTVVDESQFTKIQSSIAALDKDLVVQKQEISFLKVAVSEVKATLTVMSKDIADLRTIVVRYSAGGGVLLAALMLFKDPILKALGFN